MAMRENHAKLTNFENEFYLEQKGGEMKHNFLDSA
jgi:hypothetical protein